MQFLPPDGAPVSCSRKVGSETTPMTHVMVDGRYIQLLNMDDKATTNIQITGGHHLVAFRSV